MTPEERRAHGSAVDKKTGLIRYLSPSALQLADQSTDNGCTRKWFYAYKEGKKEPETWQQKAGTADHAIVEKYLATGSRQGLSPRVAKGIHLLPPPGTHLKIEHPMIGLYREGAEKCVACKLGPKVTIRNGEGPKHTCKLVSGLDNGKIYLRAAGIPILGRIDLMHDLCRNYGGSDVEDTEDPEGTIEVLDHKFTKNLRYAKKGADLAHTIQMVAYGLYVFNTTEAKFVRLSHVTYPTEGNAVKSTIRVTREPLDRFWVEHVEPLARSIAEASKQTSAENVKANPNACKAFGKPCIHAAYCSASSVKEHAQASALVQAIKAAKNNKNMPLLPGKNLLSHIKKPSGGAAPADDTARKAELEKLKAEETKAKLKALVPEGFGELVATIASYKKGFPQISGAAAKAYAAWKLLEGEKSYDLNDPGYTGTGDLGKHVNVTEVEDFQNLVDELAEAYGEPEAADIADSEPAGDAVVQLLPDDAPDETQTTAAAQETVETKAEPETPPAKPESKKRTSKKKAEPEVKSEPTPTVTNNVTNVVHVEPRAYPDTAINLLVDVAFDGIPAGINFARIVDGWVADICKTVGITDIRLSDGTSLSHGKWRGAIAAMVRQEAKELAAGNYYIQARGNEIYEEAVQAMRGICEASGGYWARGA